MQILQKNDNLWSIFFLQNLESFLGPTFEQFINQNNVITIGIIKSFVCIFTN